MRMLSTGSDVFNRGTLAHFPRAPGMLSRQAKQPRPLRRRPPRRRQCPPVRRSSTSAAAPRSHTNPQGGPGFIDYAPGNPGNGYFPDSYGSTYYQPPSNTSGPQLMISYTNISHKTMHIDPVRFALERASRGRGARRWLVRTGPRGQAQIGAQPQRDDFPAARAAYRCRSRSPTERRGAIRACRRRATRSTVRFRPSRCSSAGC